MRVGWSVWVHNQLVRRQNAPMKEDEDHLELGTLLKRKARLCAATCPPLLYRELIACAQVAHCRS